jgi:hypothetical protein
VRHLAQGDGLGIEGQLQRPLLVQGLVEGPELPDQFAFVQAGEGKSAKPDQVLYAFAR